MSDVVEQSGVQREIHTEAAMLAFGDMLAKALLPGSVVYLEGDLGVGKTTLCRGIIAGLGFSGTVRSPTYTLVEPYEANGQRVFHFDLYRLGDPEELEYMGYRDYFDATGICLVEWPERGKGLLPTPDLVVRITADAGTRSVELNANGSKGGIISKQL